MDNRKPNYNIHGYHMEGDTFCMPEGQGLYNREPQDIPWHGHDYGEPCTDYTYWKGKPQVMPYGFRPPYDCHHCHPSCKPNPPRKPRPNGDDYYNNPPVIPSTKKCNCKVPDRFPVSNIINVETRLVLSLDITLYAVDPKDDVTIRMEIDSKYSIIYITEEGVKRVVGHLKYIDHNISTDCLRYIGTSTDISDSAYLIVDASTEGKSDIQKIFIKSIRSIKKIDTESSNDKDNNCHCHHHKPPKYDTGLDDYEKDDDWEDTTIADNDLEITDEDYV